MHFESISEECPTQFCTKPDKNKHHAANVPRGTIKFATEIKPTFRVMSNNCKEIASGTHRSQQSRRRDKAEMDAGREENRKNHEETKILPARGSSRSFSSRRGARVRACVLKVPLACGVRTLSRCSRNQLKSRQRRRSEDEEVSPAVVTAFPPVALRPSFFPLIALLNMRNWPRISMGSRDY